MRWWSRRQSLGNIDRRPIVSRFCGAGVSSTEAFSSGLEGSARRGHEIRLVVPFCRRDRGHRHSPRRLAAGAAIASEHPDAACPGRADARCCGAHATGFGRADDPVRATAGPARSTAAPSRSGATGPARSTAAPGCGRAPSDAPGAHRRATEARRCRGCGPQSQGPTRHPPIGQGDAGSPSSGRGAFNPPAAGSLPWDAGAPADPHCDGTAAALRHAGALLANAVPAGLLIADWPQRRWAAPGRSRPGSSP